MQNEIELPIYIALVLKRKPQEMFRNCFEWMILASKKIL
jgi:hypothetical protein